MRVYTLENAVGVLWKREMKKRMKRIFLHDNRSVIYVDSIATNVRAYIYVVACHQILPSFCIFKHLHVYITHPSKCHTFILFFFFKFFNTSFDKQCLLCACNYFLFFSYTHLIFTYAELIQCIIFVFFNIILGQAFWTYEYSLTWFILIFYIYNRARKTCRFVTLDFCVINKN